MPVSPLTDMEPEPLHARVRWGNVAKAIALLAAVTLVVAWPRMRTPEPELPAGTAVPVLQAPEPIASPAITEAEEDGDPEQLTGSGVDRTRHRAGRPKAADRAANPGARAQKRKRRAARRRQARRTAVAEAPSPEPAAPPRSLPPRPPGEFSVEG